MKRLIILALLVAGLLLPTVQLFSAVILLYLSLRGLVVRNEIGLGSTNRITIWAILLIIAVIGLSSGNTAFMALGGLPLLYFAYKGGQL